MDSLRIKSLRYDVVVGCGGIGAGKFFRLNGNHTLGREESRSGRFLEIRDYCKQHIIMHYIKVLLGDRVSVVPVGKLGQDEVGETLYREMLDAGLQMDYVEKVKNASTLFSFCFVYPDGSGGNLTTDNSASSLVSAATVEKAAELIKKAGPRGMVMAAPEVPVEARQRLLELGRKHGAFCAASFTSEELHGALESGAMQHVDLLAINADEAAAIAGCSYRDAALAQRAVEKLRKKNATINVAITAGKEGSWVWDGENLTHCPVAKTVVESAAGAGDAFFSGLLCGIAAGVPLAGAQQLATLAAALSVTSPHTIHKGLDRSALSRFRAEAAFECEENILQLLKD